MSIVLMICKATSLWMIILVSTTYCNDHDGGDASYDLKKLFKPHDEFDIDNNVCNNIESDLGRASTIDKNNPTILEECQLCMHVNHVENMLRDSYIGEFEYDPTCNYYQRGKFVL